MGVKHLFITNAAGALNPSFAVGDVMFIKSHINIPSLVGVNALVGPSDARYPDVFDNLLHSNTLTSCTTLDVLLKMSA